jgi:hypothetical protein
VVERHRARDPNIQTLEDISGASLQQKDAVARDIARSYRRRALLTGAVTGLPGGLWAIVAAGADVQLTAVYSVRMAALVAQSYGYDTSLLVEQAHLAEVLALMAGVDTLRGIGNTLGREGLAHLLPEILPKLLARLSVEITEDQTAKWVGRIIPGVGAIVGGSIDYGFLRVAGRRAIDYYHSRFLAEHGLAAPAAHSALPAGTAASGRVVEGSLAAPAAPAPSAPSPHVEAASSLAPAAPAAQAMPATPATPPPAAPVAATPATATPAQVARPTNPPTDVPRRHRRPPERLAISLGVFALFFFVLTAGACAALVYIVAHALIH